jgi:hypothetical protein
MSLPFYVFNIHARRGDREAYKRFKKHHLTKQFQSFFRHSGLLLVLLGPRLIFAWFKYGIGVRLILPQVIPS